MKRPSDVLQVLEAMSVAASGAISLSVKCRIAVYDSLTDATMAQGDEVVYEKLHDFVSTVTRSGVVSALVIHARGAVLQGLSPTKNRAVPPLRPDLVMRLAEEHPSLRIVMNGGISSMQQVESLRSSERGHSMLAGVMIGRWALRRPFDMLYLSGGDERNDLLRRMEVVTEYCNYAILECQRENKDERSKIVVPLVLMIYSLELDLVGLESGVQLSRAAVETNPYVLLECARHTLIETTRVISSIDARSTILSRVNYEINGDIDASLLKRFRKALESICGKKVMSKLKSNCAEVSSAFIEDS
jgi:hypothetical protein